MPNDAAEKRLVKKFKQRKRDILDKAQEKEVSFEEIEEDIRKVEFQQYEKKIETLIMPGDEKRWEKIHNDSGVYDISEIEIPQPKEGNCIIIVKYMKERASAKKTPEEFRS